MRKCEVLQKSKEVRTPETTSLERVETSRATDFQKHT